MRGAQIPEAGAGEIQHGLAIVAKLRARFLLVCDTERQAADVAHLAARQLPLHRRVAYERAEAGAWGALS